MKKKYSVSLKDKKDWKSFTSQIGNISNKDEDFMGENQHLNRVPKLDLHGYSLDDANKKVGRFITEDFNKNYKKLLIVHHKLQKNLQYLKSLLNHFLYNNYQISF